MWFVIPVYPAQISRVNLIVGKSWSSCYCEKSHPKTEFPYFAHDRGFWFETLIHLKLETLTWDLNDSYLTFEPFLLALIMWNLLSVNSHFLSSVNTVNLDDYEHPDCVILILPVWMSQRSNPRSAIHFVQVSSHFKGRQKIRFWWNTREVMMMVSGAPHYHLCPLGIFVILPTSSCKIHFYISKLSYFPYGKQKGQNPCKVLVGQSMYSLC